MKTSVGLPIGFRRAVRPRIATNVVRPVDRLITRTQEWLEKPDQLVDLVVAYGIIGVALLVMATAVVKMLLILG